MHTNLIISHRATFFLCYDSGMKRNTPVDNSNRGGQALVTLLVTTVIVVFFFLAFFNFDVGRAYEYVVAQYRDIFTSFEQQ